MKVSGTKVAGAWRRSSTFELNTTSRIETADVRSRRSRAERAREA